MTVRPSRPQLQASRWLGWPNLAALISEAVCHVVLTTAPLNTRT